MPRTVRVAGVGVREVDERVLLATLSGETDVTRIRALNERLHADIAAAQAQLVILDLAGISAIDAEIAHELLNTAAMVQLMGSHIVTLGAGVDGIESVATPTEAFEIGRSSVSRF